MSGDRGRGGGPEVAIHLAHGLRLPGDDAGQDHRHRDARGPDEDGGVHQQPGDTLHPVRIILDSEHQHNRDTDTIMTIITADRPGATRNDYSIIHIFLFHKIMRIYASSMPQYVDTLKLNLWIDIGGALDSISPIPLLKPVHFSL